MAKLTKSRARKPLFEGGISIGGSGSNGTYSYSFMATVRDEDDEAKASYRLNVDSDEALRFVALVAGMETHEAFPNTYYVVDRRTLPEKLRALADKLEEGTTGQ